MMSYKTTKKMPSIPLVLVAVAALSQSLSAFTPVLSNRSSRNVLRHPGELLFDERGPSFRLGAESSSSSTANEDLMDTIRSMRVKELKAELEERKISTADAFEKEELVKRLYEARLSSPNPPKATSGKAASAKRNRKTDPNIIRGELSFVSMETGQSIAGMYNSESIQITDPDGNPYPTITVRVVDNNAPNGGFPLKLLVDSACSGLVLTPSVVQKNNMRTASTPVSMTGAGGAAGSAFGATQIDRFTFGYDSDNENESAEMLGPLIAAVQDIGALGTLGLDGIIGLTFLSKYACTEIDLDNAEISLYKTDYRPPYDESELEIVAEGELSPTRLGIWTVDMTFDLGDKRGKPIKMLVDTGSTSTILSWKGLNDSLGLSRNSPEVKEQTQGMGAMGSDNVAMSLTHRIDVDRSIRFGKQRGQSPQSYDGLSITGEKPAIMDIGNMPVIDTQLAADNVGGILGMNVISRFSMIRMVFSGPIPRMTLFQRKARDKSTRKETNSDDIGRGAESNKTSDVNPKPETTSKSEPESEIEIPVSKTTPSTEEKPRKKKKKRRY